MEDKEKTRSRARRIKSLFKKQKKLIKNRKTLTDFKEPILLFIKTNNTVEFYEDVTGGTFTFTPTDKALRDKQHAIIINPNKQLTFDYGDKRFRGYIHYELDAHSYPHSPMQDVKAYNIAMNKILADVKEWQSKERVATGKMFWYIFLGIAAIIGALALWSMLAPNTLPWMAKETAPTIINASQISIIP